MAYDERKKKAVVSSHHYSISRESEAWPCKVSPIYPIQNEGVSFPPPVGKDKDASKIHTLPLTVCVVLV